MKSTDGKHYIALDHVRALAIFLVVAWHFMHCRGDRPVPFAFTPTLPLLALLDEGYTGVALFMTLSGYLFAKLLDGKQVHYTFFLWNRWLRLAPLLVVVIFLQGALNTRDVNGVVKYAQWIAWGFIYPTLPNGGWSITVEFHFYLILPLLLFLLRRSSLLPLVVVITAILLRATIYWTSGELMWTAYLTIVGRIDQFVLGILAFAHRRWFAGKHAVAVCIALLFSCTLWTFDWHGGYNRHEDLAWAWILLPTLEGFAYGGLIAWYDGSFTPSKNGFSRFVGRIGEYSYSIYLLHIFFVSRFAMFLHDRVMNVSNFYVATLWSLVFLLGMMPLGFISYHYVELPFLKLRRPYLK